MVSPSVHEREQFRGAVRAFLEQHSSESEVRRLMTDELGHDPVVWRRLSQQLGVPGLLVPEELGGQGLSFVEMSLVLQESGRALLCSPVFTSAALATSALLQAAPGDERDDLLRRMADGSLIATVVDARGAGLSVDAADATAGTWTITGTLTRVLDAQLADVVLIVADLPVDTGPRGGTGLFAVRLGVDGVTRHGLSVLDLTRRQSDITLAATATVIDSGYGLAAERLADISAIAASAEMLGAAQRALDLGVAYALDRQQFGRAIGSFQAVKHLLADSLAQVEQMRATVDAGARAIADTGSSEFGEVASVVKAYCSPAGASVAETLIQVLGGIGFTWEHPAHLILRRVRSLGVLYGDAAHHRRRLATLFDLVGETA